MAFFKDTRFISVSATLTPKAMELLKRYSVKIGLPQSQLLAIALDNELTTDSPFTYPVEFPTTEYIEEAYTREAGQMERYLMKFGLFGLGRELLLMSRRDAGVDDKMTALLALRKLLIDDRIEEIVPSNPTFKGYPKGYKYLRAKDMKPEHFPEKDIEKEKEYLRKRLAKLENKL